MEDYVSVENDIELYTNIRLWTASHYRAFKNARKFPNLFFYYFPSNVSSQAIRWTSTHHSRLKELMAAGKEGLFGYYGLYFGMSGATLYSLYLHYQSVQDDDLDDERAALGLAEDAAVPSPEYQVLIDDFFASNSALLDTVGRNLEGLLESDTELKEVFEACSVKGSPDNIEDCKKRVLSYIRKAKPMTPPEQGADQEKPVAKSRSWERDSAVGSSVESVRAPKVRKRPSDSRPPNSKKRKVENAAARSSSGKVTVTLRTPPQLSKYKQISIQSFIAASRGPASAELLKLRKNVRRTAKQTTSPKEFAKKLLHSTQLELFLENMKSKHMVEQVNTTQTQIEQRVNEFLTCKSDSGTELRSLYIVNGVAVALDQSDNVLALAESYCAQSHAVKSECENPAPEAKAKLEESVAKIARVVKALCEISRREGAARVAAEFLNQVWSAVPLLTLYKQVYCKCPKIASDFFCATYGFFVLCERSLVLSARPTTETAETSEKLGTLFDCMILYICEQLLDNLEMNEYSVHLLFLCKKILSICPDKKASNQNPVDRVDKLIFSRMQSIINSIKHYTSSEDLVESLIVPMKHCVNYNNVVTNYCQLYIAMLEHAYERVVCELSFEEFIEFLEVVEKYYYNTLMMCQFRLILSALFPISSKGFSLCGCERIIESCKDVLSEYCTNDQLGVQKCMVGLVKVMVWNYQITSSQLYSVMSVLFKWIRSPRTASSEKLYKRELLIPVGSLQEEGCYAAELVGLAKEFIRRISTDIGVQDRDKTLKQTIAKLSLLCNIRSSPYFGIDNAKSRQTSSLKEDNVVEELLFYLQMMELISLTSGVVLKQSQDTLVKRVLNEFNFGILPPLFKGSILMYALRIMQASLSTAATMENPKDVIRIFMARTETLYDSSTSLSSEQTTTLSAESQETLHIVCSQLCVFVSSLRNDQTDIKSSFLHDLFANVLSLKSKCGVALKIDALNILSAILPSLHGSEPANLNTDSPDSDSQFDNFLLGFDFDKELERQNSLNLCEVQLASTLNSKWGSVIESIVDVKNYPKDVVPTLQVYYDANSLLGKIVGLSLRCEILTWPFAVSRYASDKSPLWNPSSCKILTHSQIVLAQTKFLNSLIKSSGKELEKCDSSTFASFADKLVVYITRAMVLPEPDSTLALLHKRIGSVVRANPIICGTTKGTLAQAFFSQDPAEVGQRCASWRGVIQGFLDTCSRSGIASETLAYLRNLYSFVVAQLHTNDVPTNEWVQWVQSLMLVVAKYLLGEAAKHNDSCKRLLGEVLELVLQRIPHRVRRCKGLNVSAELQKFYGLIEIFSGFDMKLDICKIYVKNIYLSLIQMSDKELEPITRGIVKKCMKQQKSWSTREQGTNLLMFYTKLISKGRKWIIRNASPSWIPENDISSCVERDIGLANEFLSLLSRKAKKRPGLLPVTLVTVLNRLFRKKREFLLALAHFRPTTPEWKKHQLRLMHQLLILFLNVPTQLLGDKTNEKYTDVIGHAHGFLVRGVREYVMDEVLIDREEFSCAECECCATKKRDEYVERLETVACGDSSEITMQGYVEAYYALIKRKYKQSADERVREEVRNVVRDEMKLLRRVKKGCGAKRGGKTFEYELQKAARKIGSTVYFCDRHDPPQAS